MTSAPYPGLRPFHADEIDVFFGREEHVDALLEKLDRSRFLAVTGTSGCGKSSLVKAGMIPALETGFLTSAGARWRVAEMRPGDRPLERLAEALLADSALGPERAGHPLAGGLLLASLRRGPLGLAEILSDTPLPERTHLLLLIDQFEEIFRYHRHGGSDQADAFVALLLATAARPGLPVYVVLTMRSDFLGDCALFEGLPEALNDSQFLTPRLDREERRSAITGPARVFGGTVEPQLVNRLLNDMGDEPDQLPLMQHLMMRLWTEAVGSGTKTHHGTRVALTVGGYEAVGGFSDALSRHADEAFGELDAPQRRIAELMFRALSERGGGQRDTRRPARLGEVAAVAGVAAADVAAVVEGFRSPDRSFLTPPAGVPLTDDSILDISHESLIRQWARLRRWVEAEAESADIYRRLVETARLWEARQAGLWGSPDLDLALAWKDRERPSATWAERYGGDFSRTMRFLAASEEKRDADLAAARRAEQQQERERRVKRISMVLGVGLAMALGLAGLALFQWREAGKQSRMAEAGLLASRAAAGLEQFPQRSLLLAAEALQIAPVESGKGGLRRSSRGAAIETLHEALSGIGGRALVGHEDRVAALTISPDGRWLISGSDDGTVRLWRIADPAAEPSAGADADAGGTVLGGHRGAVTAVAVSPDGRWLATGGQANAVLLRDLGHLEADPLVLGCHRDSITDVAFAPDSRSLLTGSQDRTACWWKLDDVGGETAAGEPVVLSGAGDAIGAVAVSPDGRWLIAASNDNDTRVWSALEPASEPVLLHGHQGPVGSLAVSPDGRWLVTGSHDNTARRWPLDRLGEDEPPSSIAFEGHASSLSALAITPDSRWLVTASHDGTARLWDLATTEEGDAATAVFRGHSGAIGGLGISPDGRWLVTVSWDETARLWNLFAADPASSSVVLRGHDRPIFALAITPDGRRVATASGDGTIRLWPVAEADATTASIVLGGFQDLVSAVAYSPDGRWLAAGSEDNTARLWDLNASNLATEPVVLAGHASSINALTISPDSRWLATGSEDNTARLWDLGSPGSSQSLSLAGHKSSINALAVSPDSRWLATASADASARLWDLESPEPTTAAAVLEGHEDSLTSVGISPDGRWLVTGSQDSTARVWSLAGDRDAAPRVLRGHQGTLTALAVSPDSRWLVTGSQDRTLRVWDLAAADPAAGGRVLEGHRDAIVAVAISPDGRWLATGDEVGATRLWRFGDFGRPIDLPYHEAAVTAVAFALDSRWLATGSADATARLWDLTSEPVSILGHLRGHRGAVTALAVGADGESLATGSIDKTARHWRYGLWTLDATELVELACKMAGRNLSEREWRHYLPPEKPYRETCPGLPRPGG